MTRTAQTGVPGVEARAGGGRWQSAEPATEIGVDTRRMSGYLPGPTGRHTIAVSAA
ncbi:MAG: hypothetical protein M3235_08040 [Actinomycetota bacterium]|nr:hypothetical protein [Actinomycetota bacterium]